MKKGWLNAIKARRLKDKERNRVKWLRIRLRGRLRYILLRTGVGLFGFLGNIAAILILVYLVYRPTPSGWEKIIEFLVSEKTERLCLILPVLLYCAVCYEWWDNERKFGLPSDRSALENEIKREGGA